MGIKIDKNSKIFWLVCAIIVWILWTIVFFVGTKWKVEFFNVFKVSKDSSTEKITQITNSFSWTELEKSKINIGGWENSTKSEMKVEGSFWNSKIKDSEIIIK